VPTLLDDRAFRPRRAPVVRFQPLLDDTPVIAPRTRRLVLALSLIAHVLLLVMLVVFPAATRTVAVADPPVQLEIVFAAPMPEIRETLPPPPPLPKPEPKPEPPRPQARPQPKVEPPPPVEVPEEPPPPPIAKVEPPPPPAAPPPPKPAVRTGLLDGAAAGPAAKTRSGPPVVTGVSGFEGIASGDGGISRERRTVASTGFGDGAVAPRSAPRAKAAAPVASAGFETQAAAPASRPKAAAVSAPTLDTDVEILSKPKPAYTDEARRLRIEGDVVLEVVFGAAGTATVLRIVQGLGHGLDEAAIDAAKKIRFNPARRDGRPVDHTASLRVVFRLA